MIVVIQCAGKKVKDAGSFVDDRGRTVKFVANPDACADEGPGVVFRRPDDPVEFAPGTWRDYLVAYNRRQDNPRGLMEAGRLYDRPAYSQLLDAFGKANVFILSAGWGLVSSNYLLPDYNITFSTQGTALCHRRKPSDRFLDFNHLAVARLRPEEKLYFLGGKNYLPLFLVLTKSLNVRKIVFHRQASAPHHDGYDFIEYPRGRTNWHYLCAADLAAGLYGDL